MSIDICITTYRNAEKLEKCLSSVLSNTKYVDYKILLWCNDPDDNIKKIVHDSMYIDDIRFTDRIVPVFEDNNIGSFSSNNNQIVTEGDAEYILFLNDDVAPLNEDWLLNMQTILDTDPKVGAVGALLLYPGGKLVQHAGVMFDQRTNGLPFHIFYKQPLTQFMTVDRYYQAVTAACMLVRRTDFNMLGGFDTLYKYGYEDCALCLKMKFNMGKSCVYCAGAQLIHHEGISGTFKQHPHLKNNMDIFRSQWKDKIFNDHQFYLNNPTFMIYKSKIQHTQFDEE